MKVSLTPLERILPAGIQDKPIQSSPTKRLIKKNSFSQTRTASQSMGHLMPSAPLVVWWHATRVNLTIKRHAEIAKQSRIRKTRVELTLRHAPNYFTHSF